MLNPACWQHKYNPCWITRVQHSFPGETEAVCCDLTWNTAKHHRAVHSPSPRGNRERSEKKRGETCGLRKRQFDRTGKEGEMIIMMKGHLK